MATIKQFLELLPSPVKEKAIECTKEEVLNQEARNFIQALNHAFSWGNTFEDFDYWYQIEQIYIEAEQKALRVKPKPRKDEF